MGGFDAHIPIDYRPAIVKGEGLPDRDEAVGEKLDAYIRWAQHTLPRYGSDPIQLTIGDNGSCFYAGFGAPLAHDDDSARAVGASIELQTPPPALDFITTMGIGIGRGLMRAGPYGSLARRTYSVIGEAANLAARLVVTSEAALILCDLETYRHAPGQGKFQELSPVWAKGKAGLIQVFHPTWPIVSRTQSPVSSHPSARPTQPALVGREVEVASPKASLDAVETIACRTLTIEGEAGIGKSRLVTELLQLARNRGLRALLGSGQNTEQKTPYKACHDVLNACFGLDEIANPSDRHARAQITVHDLGPDEVRQFPLLNDVLSLDLPDTSLSATLDPSLRQQSLFLLVAGPLRSLTRGRPLILVLEDAHWLDSLSWELAIHAARALSSSRNPLLLVLVVRPLDLGAAGAVSMSTLRRTYGAISLSLDQLSPIETVSLATGCLGLADLRRLVEALDSDARRAQVLLRLANLAEATSDFSAAIVAPRLAIEMAKAFKDVPSEAAGHTQLGRALWRQGDHYAARAQLERALDLAQATRTLRSVQVRDAAAVQPEPPLAKNLVDPLRKLEADSLRSLGTISFLQGDYPAARAYLRPASLISRQIGNRRSGSAALNDLGTVYAEQGEYARPRTFFEWSLTIYREIGDRQGEGGTPATWGSFSIASATTTLGRGVIYSRLFGCMERVVVEGGEREALSHLALLYRHLGDDEAAWDYGQQALVIAANSSDCLTQGYALTQLGHARAGLGHPKDAPAPIGKRWLCGVSRARPNAPWSPWLAWPAWP